METKLMRKLLMCAVLATWTASPGFGASDWDELKVDVLTGGTVVLDNSVSVTSPLTQYQAGTIIDGNGNSIDGNQLQILNTAGQSGTTITIINATIKNSNGNAYGGGAINNENGNTIVIGEKSTDAGIANAVVFSKNNAPGAYGGSAVRNNSAILKINDNVEFSDNYSASLGNPAGGGGNAGAISNWGTGSITIGDDATFKNNGFVDSTKTVVGAYCGGALYNDSSVTIGDNVEFTGNAASAGGGAIYNGGGSNASGSSAATLEIGKNAVFSNNTSGGEGGAIYSQRFNETQPNVVNIGEGARFSGNSAQAGAGGAIASYSTALTVGAGSTFTNNTSNGDGGAIYSDTYGFDASSASVNILAGTTFSGNSANNGGAIYNAAGKLTLDTTVITLSDNSVVNEISFTGNTANSGADIYQVAGAETEIKGGAGTTLSMDGGIAGAGAITKSGENTFVLSGDSSAYTGTYTQSAGKTIISGEFISGTATIEGGEFIIDNTATLHSNVVIGSNIPEITISKAITSINNDGLNGVIELQSSEGFDLGANKLDLIINGAGNALMSNINSIGGGANIRDLTFNGGAGLAEDEEITVNGSTLTFGSETENQYSNVITLNDANSVLNLGNANNGGTINLNASILNNDTGATINKDYNTLVNILGDKSAYTGNFSQTAGTTIITDGSYFFGGNNTVSGGELVLENGGHFAEDSVNNIIGAGLNDPYGTLVLRNDELGAENTVIDWATGTVTIIDSPSTSVTPHENVITINKGGLHLANGLVQESNYEGGFSLFEGQTGIRELELSNGSGILGNIAANDHSTLTYNDGAFIDDKATIMMGDDVTVNMNFDVDTVFDTNIVTATSGGAVSNINKNGVGDVSMANGIGAAASGSLVNTNLNVNGGEMTLQGDVAILGDINLQPDAGLLANGQIIAKDVNADNAMIAATDDFNLTGDLNLLNTSSAELYGANNNIAGSVVINNSDFDAVNNVNIAQNLTIANGNIDLSLSNKASSIIVGGTTNISGVNNLSIKADGRDYSAGGIKTKDLVVADEGAEIVLSDIDFVATPRDYNFNIQVIKSVNEKTGGDLIINLRNKLIDTPVGKYSLIAGEGGRLFGNLESINPQAYRGQVATVASYANQLVHNNLMFDHINIVSQQLIAQEKMANKYASIDAQFSPYQYSATEGSLWYKAYGNFETISMTRGLNVHNNAYGSLIGADFPLVNLRNGWKLIPTAYVSYNGAHQTFNGVSMYQNGGQLGLMGTAYKGDFITSLLAYGGGYYNNMSVAGNQDRTGNWFAGVASKSAYNFNLPADFILQPTMLLSYNIFGEQNWHSNYGIIGMNSGMLNGINIAPGMNLIWNKETFSIYGTAQLVFNIMGDVKGQIGNIDLPSVGYRHVAYVEYGLGATKRIKERLNSFIQFTIRNGTRTGIGFQGGLQWKI